MTIVPGAVWTVAWKRPAAFAAVLTTDVLFAGDVGWPAEITTVAPGGAVPVTTVWDPVTMAPWAGDVMAVLNAAGGLLLT